MFNTIFAHPHDAFAVSLIRPTMENGPWIAGGAPLAWYKGMPAGVGDIDVFFKDQAQFDEYLDRFINLSEKFGLWSRLKETDIHLYQVHKSNNAISYRVSSNVPIHKLFEYANINLDSREGNSIVLSKKPTVSVYTIQLINAQYYKSAEDVINSFDISAIQIVSDGLTFKMGENTALDIKNKTLRYNKKLIDTSLKRIMKYWVYGYQPTPELLRELKASNIKWDKTYDDNY